MSVLTNNMRQLKYKEFLYLHKQEVKKLCLAILSNMC